MARKSLSNPCVANSRLSHGERYDRSKGRETVVEKRVFVEDEQCDRKFDRMMRSNRGVL